jgi:hypothetical protein
MMKFWVILAAVFIGAVNVAHWAMSTLTSTFILCNVLTALLIILVIVTCWAGNKCMDRVLGPQKDRK